ncbi:MAG: cadmium-translocating P-type ATPase [Streptococcaceae bacterium]|jgi:heavy metal translocating P-type ATPase|nr:cadmium-translocating P-type ATPase [Streptococcaceae bacterium]
MKNFQKLVITFAIAIAALLLSFVFGQPFAAQVLVSVAGSFLALTMAIEMVKTLRSGRYGVDLLAITAIIATLLVGEIWAALIIIVMLVGGESLEDYAANVAHRNLTALLEKSPDTANVRRNGELISVPVTEVKIGETLLIKPLEVVPIDGKLLSEHATLDEASLTGESRPYELTAGAEVLSGALNQATAFDMETTELANDSQIQKIVHLVKDAESQPATFVRLADRYAVPFTLIAYVIAGIAFALTRDPRRIAEVLVVASPCPLILAAPIAFVSGMSRASKAGILIKNGTVIEKLATARSIFLDKTGTITSGKLKVARVNVWPGTTETELLEYVYSLERVSNHILAKAVSAFCEKHQIKRVIPQALTEIPGMGVTGEVAGDTIKIGRKAFANTPESVNYDTAFYVSKNDEFIGSIVFDDKIRDDATSVISELHTLGVEKVTMLTGDSEKTAQRVAKEVGIDTVYAQLMPDEKLAHIKNETLKPTIMVGDGINDAPALALADVGIAMGIGENTVASETADLVLLKNEISAVPRSIHISRDTLKIARQAVGIGIAICVVLMLVAALGIIPATVGALLQEVVDTVSIFYALRALRG